MLFEILLEEYPNFDIPYFQVFITNGILSDVVIVVAITDPTAKSNAHGITLFLVEDGMPGTCWKKYTDSRLNVNIYFCADIFCNNTYSRFQKRKESKQSWLQSS